MDDRARPAAPVARPYTVALLTRKYPPSVGGMQRWSASLGCALAAVAAQATDGQRAVLLWAPPLPVARAAAPLALGGLALHTLTRVVREPVALVHLGDAALAPVAPFLRAALRCRVTATVHGLDVTYPARWYQALVMPALRRLDAVIAVSHATAAACAERGVPVRAVIPNGVDARAWAALPSRTLARAALGLDDGLWLLSVGRLVRRKGLAWFVSEVLARLARDVPRVRLLVVGDGPERPWIEAAARVAGVAERVCLLGTVSDDTLRLAHAAADVFVMPNLRIAGDPEGFGLVALEAAAAGLPVVASAVDGIPDAVGNGAAGVLVPPGDATRWLAVLRAVLDDEEWRTTRGACAREQAQARCDWSSVAAAYWHVFDDVMTQAECVT